MSLRQFMEARLDAIHDSMRTSNTTIDVRLAGMNEWRSTVNDILSRALTRDQAGAEFGALRERLDTAVGKAEDRIGVLERAAAQAQGRNAAYVGIAAALVAAFNLVITSVGVIVAVVLARGR